MTNCQYTQLQVRHMIAFLGLFPLKRVTQGSMEASQNWFSPCVQEYVRLIGPWCQVNIGSCRFMLAQCYLANGEGQKVGWRTKR